MLRHHTSPQHYQKYQCIRIQLGKINVYIYAYFQIFHYNKSEESVEVMNAIANQRHSDKFCSLQILSS